MRGRTPSIKSLFRGRLVAAGIVVVLAAACAQFVHSAALLREAVRQRLTVTAELSAAQIADFIAHHQAAVSLCAARHTLEPDGRRALFELRERFPAFLTVLAADAEGRILHGEPQLRADGEAPFRWAGHAVADRDYFRVPMRTGRPYVSDVFVGRGYGDDPIIALSAPVFDARGRVNGIVEGSIASPAFAAARAEAMARRGMALLVLDRRGRVVYATRDLRLRALQTVALPPPPADPTALGELPDVYAPGEGAHFASARTGFGWTVVVLEPVERLNGELRLNAFNLLFPGLLALIAAVWAASALAGRLAQPIRTLALRMREYAFDGEGNGHLPLPSAPAEIRDLTDAFNRMGQRLSESYETLRSALVEKNRLGDELTRTVQEREEVIAERTAALRRANSELRALSATDALTGCSNYRGFVQAMAMLWQRAGDEYQTVTAFMCDIDRFKRYNDALGHPAGDACLRRVAAALRGVMQLGEDVVARVGGEEFAVLVRGLDRAQARAVAHRLHDAVGALQMPHPDGGTVSISVGWAQVEPAEGGVPEDLVAAADAALYRAKEAGRDRVAE
ncbi:diguanylate cyclase domain-containing protein [Vulcaniibacterium thermophilum]|uniref:diguanylate cyclase n=1 Tax=Vulcaniibacterium thermophilum TaxID=1169913 RepID=A0A918Z3R3_9GAMM|nr:diguanylate cyclase [Vulcaniibacterium thermophilum]GHE36546.1 hypothetical protein GCM10007167_18500 [Vulcaniibacterium thermophilum]